MLSDLIRLTGLQCFVDLSSPQGKRHETKVEIVRFGPALTANPLGVLDAQSPTKGIVIRSNVR